MTLQENKLIHVEIAAQQKPYHRQLICGDTFITRRIKEENRYVAILSDGMGHGVKANVLSTLTATMAVNFTLEHKEEYRIAEIIMSTLPVCSERKMSYSTFTICDIAADGMVKIIEYDNPQTFVLRNGKPLDLNWQCLYLDLKNASKQNKEIKFCSFYPKKEDRIIFVSDGITQTAMGNKDFPFGWGEENLRKFVAETVRKEPRISARQLANKVVAMSNKLDNFEPKDDSTCAVIYFRDPRRLLVVTGPPYHEEDDKKMAEIFDTFDGKKVICGATTADIISRELDRKITDSFDFEDPELPPLSYIQGAEFITEGILTLSKISNILFTYTPQTKVPKGPAGDLLKLMMESDEIFFLIGTKINIAHQDPNLPVDLEIRRTVIRRIAKQLEEKLLKDVHIEFI